MLPPQRWLKLVLLANVLVFSGVAIYVFGFAFSRWIECDASVSVLLAAKALHAKTPVLADWYYANGDVWVLAPHLFALLPVAILGVGEPSLLISVLIAFVIELVVLGKVYARLCGQPWSAGLGAIVTLMAWSSAHVAFVYIQPAYGFLATLYVVLFGALALSAVNASARSARWIAIGGFAALIAMQNPTRGLVLAILPLVVACAWPWRGIPGRRRLAIAGIVVAGWLVALIIYIEIFERYVSFSMPRGMLDFQLQGASGMLANLKMLGRGLTLLCSDSPQLDLRTIPGLLVLAGALVIVCREVFASRAATALRFYGFVMLAQLGLLLVPLITGNLLQSPASARYLMPALLPIVGLAAMVAARTCCEAGARWGRRIAVGWLAIVPVAAAIAVPSTRPPTPQKYIFPNAPELADVAAELAHRGLTHGFSSVLNANILALEARGAVLVCPVYFVHVLIPQRWLADTSCYTASALPDRFFVVADHDDRDVAALRATLPPPIEHFSVGATYDVSVFRTADMSPAWLDLPLADGDQARFPLLLPATHVAFHHDKVAVETDRLVATGGEGYVLFGPYMKLPPGKYTLIWIGRPIESPGTIFFIAAADVGNHELARVTRATSALSPGELARITFELDRTRADVEFSVFSAGGGRVELDELIVERE
jgi:hypothetical protein